MSWLDSMILNVRTRNVGSIKKIELFLLEALYACPANMDYEEIPVSYRVNKMHRI
jgi:hypothetical protein